MRRPLTPRQRLSGRWFLLAGATTLDLVAFRPAGGPASWPAGVSVGTWAAWAGGSSDLAVVTAVLRDVVAGAGAALLALVGAAVVTAGPGQKRSRSVLLRVTPRSLRPLVALGTGTLVAVSAAGAGAAPPTPRPPVLERLSAPGPVASGPPVLWRVDTAGSAPAAPGEADHAGGRRGRTPTHTRAGRTAREAGAGRRGRGATTVPAGTWTVAPGDSLWSISAGHLERSCGPGLGGAQLARYWSAVVTANRVGHPDPDLIFPGDIIRLPAARL